MGVNASCSLSLSLSLFSLSFSGCQSLSIVPLVRGTKHSKKCALANVPLCKTLKGCTSERLHFWRLTVLNIKNPPPFSDLHSTAVLDTIQVPSMRPDLLTPDLCTLPSKCAWMVAERKDWMHEWLTEWNDGWMTAVNHCLPIGLKIAVFRQAWRTCCWVSVRIAHAGSPKQAPVQRGTIVTWHLPLARACRQTLDPMHGDPLLLSPPPYPDVGGLTMGESETGH